MKAIRGLCLLLLLPVAWAQAPLNFENLLLLQTTPEQLQDPEWQKAWLSAVDPALLRKMQRHGRDAWTEKQLKQLTKTLAKRRKQLLREGLYLDRKQQLLDYDAARGGAPVNSTFHRYLITLQGKGNDNAFFKRGQSALLLNPQDEMTVLPFNNRDAWAEWFQIREIEQGTRRARTLHVRYFLQPGRVVQPGVLELALQGYQWSVEDYTRLKKLGEKTWKVDWPGLREKNPLAEGFGTRLVPIHSLMIDGMSLGEVMVRFPQGDCQEGQPIAGHRLFICTHPRAEYVYLDGQMVRMRQYRRMDPTDGMPKATLRWAQQRLAYPARQWKAMEWRKGRSLLRTVALPDKADDHWLFFEATHGEVPGWLKADYQALP